MNQDTLTRSQLTTLNQIGPDRQKGLGQAGCSSEIKPSLGWACSGRRGPRRTLRNRHLALGHRPGSPTRCLGTPSPTATMVPLTSRPIKGEASGGGG